MYSPVSSPLVSLVRLITTVLNALAWYTFVYTPCSLVYCKNPSDVLILVLNDKVGAVVRGESTLAINTANESCL